VRYIYTLFLYLVLPFLPLRLLWRSRKNAAYRKRILERFAYYQFSALTECIWVHAVSVGEVVAAVPLINFLIKRYVDTAIVVTTMTPTGAEVVQKNFGNKVKHIYVPYDYPGVIKRFLRQVKPKLLILMETELWPNLLYYTDLRNIPIILCNARLSAKSYSGFMKIQPFIKSVLDCITLVMAQSVMDGERFLSLGLEPARLSVIGNTKFDLNVPEEVLFEANKLRLVIGQERLIWVAASTHEHEEEKILFAAKKVLEVLPNVLLILVPRHQERFDKVYTLCKQENFNVVRYTDISNYSGSTNIILGDVIGQMFLFYALSDIAFVGGSLVPWGGHNLLEPAALAKPVITGPHLGSFLEISQLLSGAGALVKVDDESHLAQNLLNLFQDPILREKLGVVACNVITEHRGASKKIFAVVKNIIAGHYLEPVQDLM